jgi:hypothetical protein
MHGNLIEQERTPWPDSRELRISGIEFGTDRGKGARLDPHVRTTDRCSCRSEEMDIHQLRIWALAHAVDLIYLPLYSMLSPLCPYLVIRLTSRAREF